MVATASRTPARNDWRLNSATRQAAMSAATTTVNCCSKIPWATAKLPSVNARTLTVSWQGRFPLQKAHPGPYRRAGQSDQKPAEYRLYGKEWQFDQRSQQKHDVNRISKTLLVGGIVGTRRVEWTAVISSLNVACNLGTIGIAVVQQKFPSPEPPGIEIRQDASWTMEHRGIGQLMRHQNPADVKPHAPSTQQCKQHGVL